MANQKKRHSFTSKRIATNLFALVEDRRFSEALSPDLGHEMVKTLVRHRTADLARIQHDSRH
jgi:hypothetical protein